MAETEKELTLAILVQYWWFCRWWFKVNITPNQLGFPLTRKQFQLWTSRANKWYKANGYKSSKRKRKIFWQVVYSDLRYRYIYFYHQEMLLRLFVKFKWKRSRAIVNSYDHHNPGSNPTGFWNLTMDYYFNYTVRY